MGKIHSPSPDAMVVFCTLRMSAIVEYQEVVRVGKLLSKAEHSCHKGVFSIFGRYDKGFGVEMKMLFQDFVQTCYFRCNA